jgi:hypothetical protein
MLSLRESRDENGAQLICRGCLRHETPAGQFRSCECVHYLNKAYIRQKMYRVLAFDDVQTQLMNGAMWWHYCAQAAQNHAPAFLCFRTTAHDMEYSYRITRMRLLHVTAVLIAYIDI